MGIGERCNILPRLLQFSAPSHPPSHHCQLNILMWEEKVIDVLKNSVQYALISAVGRTPENQM